MNTVLLLWTFKLSDAPFVFLICLYQEWIDMFWLWSSSSGVGACLSQSFIGKKKSRYKKYNYNSGVVRTTVTSAKTETRVHKGQDKTCILNGIVQGLGLSTPCNTKHWVLNLTELNPDEKEFIKHRLLQPEQGKVLAIFVHAAGAKLLQFQSNLDV